MATAVIAKGSASISINIPETEARLIFVPDPDGDGWDIAAINKLAQEKQISAYPDQKQLENFLSKAARVKTSETMEFVLSQGTPPEEPVAETVKWEILAVPGDMAPFQEEALANVSLPRMIRTKVEKVKHEKKIKKTGALPFMPAKEEVEITWEKKETREEVLINPNILEVKYADKGMKLGTVSPSVPGKPGKSIFGRPVPPQRSEDGTFLLGEHIAREKNDLTALVSGFIRIGENWVDLVPLSKPSFSINAGIDGITLFFRFEPGDERFTPPTGEEILAAAAAKGAAAENLVSAGEIDEVISTALNTGEPVEAFCLYRMQDAIASVDINPEKTLAVLHLRKGVAGALPLEMKAISQAIKDSGVHGFNAEKLKADILAFLNGKDQELKDYILVEGKPSTRGRDREVQILASLLPDDEKKTILSRVTAWYDRRVSVTEAFDLKQLTGLAFVEGGVVIAKVSAASDGEEGKDIYGSVIPGLPGNDPKIKFLGGLDMHGSDITASRNGLLLLNASEKTFCGEVISYGDARITVQITDDAMEAKGDLSREEGAGIPLTVENVIKVLGTLGIKKGIDIEGVEKACAFARAKGSVSGIVLARGQPALAPGTQAIKWHLQPGEAETPIQVKAGKPIADISEPFAEGRSGYDVKGTEIPIENGTSLVIEHDNSVKEIKAGRGRRLVAARSGELCFDGRKLDISSVKAIEGDAGPQIGNISFSGEIKISGSVLPGCAIICGSHVTVDGLAEEALISAGGKVFVALGIKGGDRGIVRARAGINAAFSERASLMAVGDIQLKKGSIRSIIKTNGKLIISDDNGRLSGGICQARHGLSAADIGSEKGIRTEISFGQDYLIKDQIAVCEEEIITIRRKLTETDEKVKYSLEKSIPLSDEIRNEKIKLVKLLEQLNIRVFTLREKFEEHHESEITIRGSVFPGVVMESHNRYYEIRQKRSRVILYFDCETGSIREKPFVKK